MSNLAEELARLEREATQAAKDRKNALPKVPMDETWEPVAVLRAKEALWEAAPRLLAALALAEAVDKCLSDPLKVKVDLLPSERLVADALLAFRAADAGEGAR